MADIILSNGREIDFDLSKMTLVEYRGFFSSKQSLKVEDEIITRVTGLTLEEYQNLPFPDYKQIVRGLLKKAREPLADPS